MAAFQMGPIVYEALITKALEALRSLAVRNPRVAPYLFSNISILLAIPIAMEGLATTLKQARHLCFIHYHKMKVIPCHLFSDIH